MERLEVECKESRERLEQMELQRKEGFSKARKYDGVEGSKHDQAKPFVSLNFDSSTLWCLGVMFPCFRPRAHRSVVR